MKFSLFIGESINKEYYHLCDAAPNNSKCVHNLVDLDNVATDIAMGAAMYRSMSSADSANSVDGNSHESGPPATPGNRVCIL